MENNAKIDIRLPSAHKEALQRLADDDGRKITDYCRRVLEKHVASRKVGISGNKDAGDTNTPATIDLARATPLRRPQRAKRTA